MVDKTNIGKSGGSDDGPDDNNNPAAGDEELFENYLDGDSSVAKAYRELTPAEPPADLDRAVLEMARKAAQPSRKSLLNIDLMFWRHWARPISMVVIMGVCLTVVLRVMDYRILAPAPDEQVAFALMEPAQDQALGRKRLESPATTDVLSSARYSRLKTDIESETAVIQATPERSVDKPASIAQDSYLEERKVTARKQEESLREVPLSITAYQDEQIVVSARSPLENAAEIDPADSALEAWQKGAQPAAEVWLAGIETLYMSSAPDSSPETDDRLAGVAYDLAYAEPADIEIELAKMARTYPTEARQFREQKGLITFAATAEAEQMKVRRQIVPQPKDADAGTDAPTVVAAEPASFFIDPYVWTAGINWLYENGRDTEAKAEQEKLRLIYPDFKPE
jgi:hypothetical protein